MEKRDKGKPNRVNTGLCMVHYVVNVDDEEDLRELLMGRGLETNSLSES